MDLSKAALHASAKKAAASTPYPPLPLATSAEDEPQIPSPHLFEGLTTCNSTIPSIAQCAVHLEFLEVIFALQQRTINSNALDRTFNIEHSRSLQWTGSKRTFQRDSKSEPEFQRRRKQKWQFFASAAAVRFEAWWTEVLKPQVNLNQITENNLPPLDVLMIWHALLLNPKLYRKRCLTQNVAHILLIPFPWSSIHSSINSRDRTFTINATATRRFTRKTQFSPDLFALLSAESLAKGISANLSIQGSAMQNDELSRIALAKDSPETTALVSALTRQMPFTTSMAYHYIWLRSPSPAHTLSTSLQRYVQFLSLFKTYPGTMLVPTLDIDLVWHTHQLSPQVYYKSTLERCGRMIDHDAGLGKDVLGEGMERTRSLWERMGEEWGVHKRCLCWECLGLECLLGADEGGEDDGFDKVDDLEGLDGKGIDSKMDRMKGFVEFHRAVEKARRKGGMLPNKKALVKLIGRQK